MTKRTDHDAIDLDTSIEGAENAVRVIQEIMDGGSVIQKIEASLEQARKLQRQRSIRERRISLEIERNMRRFRFLVEHGFGSSRVHPWAPHLQMSP